jgi:hypothetical protein
MILNATISLCDDIRFEVGGKITLVGVYLGDVSIIPGPYPVKQLVFLVNIEGTLEDLPRELAIEVAVPSLEPRRKTLTLPTFDSPAGRTTWFTRGVVAFENELLQAGRVVAKVIADGVEYEVGSPWIVEAPPPALEAAANP